jgi:hypothetical protein
VHRRGTEAVALAEIKIAELGTAELYGILEDGTNTGFNWPGEELITLSTSEAAVSCSSASSRSRASCAVALF